jgi:hypothetical protein
MSIQIIHRIRLEKASRLNIHRFVWFANYKLKATKQQEDAGMMPKKLNYGSLHALLKNRILCGMLRFMKTHCD